MLLNNFIRPTCNNAGDSDNVDNMDHLGTCHWASGCLFGGYMIKLIDSAEMPLSAYAHQIIEKNRILTG